MLPRQVPVFAALLFLLAISVTAAIFETGLPRACKIAVLDYSKDGLLDSFPVNSGFVDL